MGTLVLGQEPVTDSDADHAKAQVPQGLLDWVKIQDLAERLVQDTRRFDHTEFASTQDRDG